MKVGDALGVSRGPVPAGMYELQINGEQTICRDGKSGRQLSVLSEILNGEHQGQGIWQNFNLTKEGIFYFATFINQIGFGEEEEMGDPYSEDEVWNDFIASLAGVKYSAEVTLEEVYSKKQQKNIEVNKVVNVWAAEPDIPSKAEAPATAKKILGPKEEPAKPSKPASRPTGVKPGPVKKDVPKWAREEGEESVGEELPI